MSGPANAPDPFLVTLDVGSTSIRALLFDSGGRQVEGYGAHLATNVRKTAGGAASADPHEMAEMALDCLDDLHRQTHAAGLRIAAIAGSAFWHGLMGIDSAGKPTTALYHLLDTQSGDYALKIPDASVRTGCPRHSSYWPAKLLWLAATKPEAFAATDQWITFPEYLWSRLFGKPRASVSIASANGLWDQRQGDYDAEILAATGVRREQLANPREMDLLEREPLPEFQHLWPGFTGASWFPLLGDGAMNNLGSGCVRPDAFSLMAGTTGAMRVVLESIPGTITPGLWTYRVDRSRAVIGGALSNGGEVYAWLKRTLSLPKDVEAQLEKSIPGTHGLVFLPFFAGERTPYWRSDLHAAIAGLTFSTEPMDLMRAALEAVALGFRQIYGLLTSTVPVPAQVIASGGALVRSPGWTQMMADALGRPVTQSTELEASSRGAALWAMEQLGMIPDWNALPASTGAVFDPRPQYEEAYANLFGERASFYAKLFGSGT